MATVLIVDDSQVDQRLAGTLLQKHLGAALCFADDGRQAVEAMQKQLPDLVLTDLQMPHMNGLSLVEHVRRHYPLVPVILMTAHGSEEIAVEALKRGAASYVPKRRLVQELADTVGNVLSVAKADREHRRILDRLTETEASFVLDNDPEMIAPLIGYLERLVKGMNLCDETGLIRVAVALREALVNAIEHGNLEASPELREESSRAYYDMLQRRRREEPFASRRIFVNARIAHDRATYVIRDEGQGFDPSTLPDPTDPENLECVSGRGLLLIRTFMDQVHHGDEGREITMVLRRQSADRHS